jgi:hypothetical protein
MLLRITHASKMTSAPAYLPLSYRHGPFLADVVQCQEEQFEYSLIGWKRAPGFGDFPQVLELTTMRKAAKCQDHCVFCIDEFATRIG